MTNPDTQARYCHQCGAPLNRNERFCRECGQSLEHPLTLPATPPPASPPPVSPPPAPPSTADPSSSAPTPSKAHVPILIGLLVGGLLMVCILGTAGGVYLWRQEQDSPPALPPVLPTANTRGPAPTKAAVSDERLETPAAVVDQFIKATLGTVPEATLNYEQARSLMTASYAATFNSAAFVPTAYGIQDGPTAYEIASEELSDSTATVLVLGYWDDDLSRRWQFALQIENLEWKIAAIDLLPLAGTEPAELTALRALEGEWELVEDDGEPSERFQLQLEADGRMRLRLIDEYTDRSGIEELERFYLELRSDGPRRWQGDLVHVDWDPEAGETTEWDREPIVILLSADGDEMLLGPPASDAFVARRVGP